jgi:hypothetical protein
MPIISLSITGTNNIYRGYLGKSMLRIVLKVFSILL